MSKEFVAVVTEGMLVAADHAYDRLTGEMLAHDEGRVILNAALAHPDFQRQVRAYAAAVARGCVPDELKEDVLIAGAGAGHSYCRAETLAAIDRWERGE